MDLIQSRESVAVPGGSLVAGLQVGSLWLDGVALGPELPAECP